MKHKKALLIITVALVLLAAPVNSPGQQTAKVYRIGFFVASAPTSPATALNRQAFEV